MSTPHARPHRAASYHTLSAINNKDFGHNELVCLVSGCLAVAQGSRYTAPTKDLNLKILTARDAKDKAIQPVGAISLTAHT